MLGQYGPPLMCPFECKGGDLYNGGINLVSVGLRTHISAATP